MSDEENKTRATTGGKFSAFKQVGPQEGNPVEVVGLRDGENVRAPLTTDLIETNPGITFRNAKGQFASPDPSVGELTNQLKVNRYLYDRMLERGVTIDVDPPEIYADGTFWFCNDENSMQLFVYHADSDAWIPVAPPASISDRVAAGEDVQSGLVEAVSELETKVTALEGAVGEHSLIFNPDRTTPRAGEFVTKDGGNQVVNTLSAASIIHISPEDRNGGAIAIDRITAGDVMRLSDINGVTAEVKIKNNLGGGAYEMEKLFGDLDRLSEYPYDFNLFSSFDPQGLATIDYVDEQDERKYDKTGGDISGQVRINPMSLASGQRLLTVSHSSDPKFYIYTSGQSISRYNVKSGDDGQTLATKAYVDKKAPDGHSRSTPVSEFLWKYMAGGASAIKSGKFGSGCFTVEFDSSDKPTCLYFSEHVGSGRYWIPGSWANYTRSIGNTIVTVQEWDGSVVLMGTTNKWHFITRREKNDGSGSAYTNDLYVSDTKPGLGTHSLVDGRQYAIRGPSPFPVMGYSYDEFMNGTSASFGIEEGTEEVDKIDEGGAEQ